MTRIQENTMETAQTDPAVRTQGAREALERLGRGDRARLRLAQWRQGWVQAKIDAGNAPECWSRLWLTSNKGTEAKKLDYHEAAHAIGSSSFVAIATIGGPLHAFLLSLCHYPEWLPKLQEEIDRVCGDRMPTQEDMPDMPRLRATCKEMLRWRQSTPLGVPHVTLEDDVYNGYFIPKGAEKINKYILPGSRIQNFLCSTQTVHSKVAVSTTRLEFFEIEVRAGGQRAG